MEDALIVRPEPATKAGKDIQKNPIKKKAKKKVGESTADRVERVLKAEAARQPEIVEEISPEQQAIDRRIIEWKKRKERDKKQIRVRFRDYFLPNYIRTIQWQAYGDWPVRMWKVRDGDIITMDLGTIRGLTATGKKKVLEVFNDAAFGGVRPHELQQTKYIEKIIQLYGFESLEFDNDVDLMPSPQILKPRSEVIFAQ